jgi:hypothetical protein
MSAIDRDSYEDWLFLMRTGIMSAAIANMALEHTREGKGKPKKADMKRFATKAGDIADLWEETVAP